jgi:hypothetical protein
MNIKCANEAACVAENDWTEPDFDFKATLSLDDNGEVKGSNQIESILSDLIDNNTDSTCTAPDGELIAAVWCSYCNGPVIRA